jgi:hypothetical protein
MLVPCLVPVLVHAEPPADVHDYLISIFDQAEQASKNKNYQKVKILLDHADEIIGKRPQDYDDFVGVLGRATLQLRLASAIGDGQLGDACAHIRLSKTYKASIPDPDPTLLIDPRVRKKSLATLTSQTDAEAARFGCNASAKPILRAADKALAGQYYLADVTDIGSELLLKPDGTFEWSLADGEVAQTSHGTWQREAGDVVLTADKDNVLTDVFTLGPLQPWDIDAEYRLQRIIFDKMQAELQKRCPFRLLDDHPTAVMVSPRGDAEGGKLRRRAKSDARAAKVDVEAKRQFATKAAQIAMVATSDRTQKMAAATKAMIDWSEARVEMLGLYSMAGLDEPKHLEPSLPAACVSSQHEVLDEKDPTKWQRGFAVLVEDPNTSFSFSNIKVAFTYADGVVEERLTDFIGFAILPVRASIPIIRLTATFHNQGGPFTQTFAPETLTIEPTISGIQRVNVNPKAASVSPFHVLRVKIDGQDLVSAELQNGHYKR